jgi:protein-tyrosine-phosphatase
MNVHFICRGNVLRSLIAETYLKSLRIDGMNVISSGTNVNWNDPQECEYFTDTMELLKKHGIDSYAKKAPDQLTQSRLDKCNDVVILMNDRVVEEAHNLVTLPENLQNWNIVDIGEGHRTDLSNREQYEEEIYREIVDKVDRLFDILVTV